MKNLKKNFKYLLRFVVALFSLIIFYLLVSLILSAIPVNKNYQKLGTGISIYVKTNGIHTDFIVPAKNEIYDWQPHFNEGDFNGFLNKNTWLAFGWGDKAFYIGTPTMSDLNVLTAAKSLLINTPSAMHITAYRFKPKVDEDCIQVFISESQYQILINHIKNSFIANKKNKFKMIQVAGYQKNDRFFKSDLSYNLIDTCNYWVVAGLKKMGIKTAFWSPFDCGIFWHL